MKKKLFVVSDIHGYYDQFIEALKNSGFDENNPDHFLISLGDNFDRGSKPIEVMEYLMNLPRKVLIRGNHEDLFIDVCERGFPWLHDISNGTSDTITKIAEKFPVELATTYLSALIAVNPFFNEMVDGFETKNYVFVHGYIPCNLVLVDQYGESSYSPIDWRNATAEQWKEARWINPFLASKTVYLDDKKIVCGHWHCSYGWAQKNGTLNMGGDFDDHAIWEPYEDEHIIAIDRCTAHTGKVNVLVLEDEFVG